MNEHARAPAAEWNGSWETLMVKNAVTGCVCACVCVTAVWSFISTKWQINQSAATVGLRSLTGRAINLQLHLPLSLLLNFHQTGCGCWHIHPNNCFWNKEKQITSITSASQCHICSNKLPVMLPERGVGVETGWKRCPVFNGDPSSSMGTYFRCGRVFLKIFLNVRFQKEPM